ncbi:anthranilate phosphoribosyltransferase [Methanothrix soehngenii]|jgi:anthranilate phosphoribosyltransferase|uniref:anthranilate phosphoribosyltransferase n=1 Tax=Methanothrix soehngenii TaxID=2223 RepID=UPI0023F15A29|nr:anthranilate phosphoribosyltransferase [Methanothrix soehngenii]MCK9585796.1 anthranilate phosphoribosyltransferase [Methanothrix soehngenii]MDD5257169.1 anthranilate phosphoribosyltransferase [Methanothrix soehngenii]
MAKDLLKIVSEESLKHFGGKVDELIKGRNLTRGEASDLFRQILNDEQPDLQQGAFLAAITAKGATAEEIAGIWEAIYEVDTLKVRPCVQGPLADNCGTGMDSIKTFNISTAASIVAAADNINMAKHGSRAITSSCGTVDMLEQLGIDVDCDVDLVKRSIEVAGIGIFNGMSGKVHPSALSRILSQIRFGTVLNIAGSLANPALPAYGVRGVYSREMVLPIARAMKEIGYKRAFVVHGRSGDDLRGMDELSTLGRTDVAELDEDGRIREYALNACDLGLEKGDESALLNRGNIEEEAVRLLRVLSGFDRGDRRDIVCLNAAPLLCITGRSEDLLEGVGKAGDIIDSGRAIKKLVAWVREQNEDPGERLERLEGMLELARA